MTRTKILISLTIAGICFLVAFCAGARAHQAPSGWAYPTACCSEADCYPIGEDEVVPLPAGAYRVIRTGEVFHHPDAKGLPADARQYRWSGDAQFHRCSFGGDPSAKASICLLVPQPGV